MIRVEKLHKAFRDGDRVLEVLRDVSIQVDTGEFVALLGRSGSGKSTFLNCLAGIETADSGEVVLDGRDITRLSDRQRTHFRRDAIGIVFQFFNLLPVLTVMDNVLLPAELAARAGRPARRRAQELLEQLGLADRSAAYPDQLSGGEQQRVAIARALINEPQLLLADEPTGNLDSATGATTLEILARLNQHHRLTVILATHSQQAASCAQRVIQLRDGALVGTT